jgi:hypothetical protein
MKSKILFATVAVATLAIAASLLNIKFIASISIVGAALRWLAIVLIAANAIRRRSLTSWILVGLLAGAETGHDWPGIAINLQFSARFSFALSRSSSRRCSLPFSLWESRATQI